MNNDSRDEQLKQIRERQARCARPDRDDVPRRSADPLARELARELRQAQTDRAFLLSLYDGQAIGGADFEHYWDEYQYPFLPDGVAGYEHAKRAWSAAATRMRERCVDAIKSLRAVPRGLAYGNAVNDAIHKVESVTLDAANSVKDSEGCPEPNSDSTQATHSATGQGANERSAP